MSYSNPQTWLVEDVEFFPTNFLAMGQPHVGVFLAVEGQSTDDGRVFFNLFQNQDDISFVSASVSADGMMDILSTFKSLAKATPLKQYALDKESEQGVVGWQVDNENFVVACFASNATPVYEELAKHVQAYGKDCSIGQGKLASSKPPRL